MAVATLDFYTEYFDIGYPLPKVTLSPSPLSYRIFFPYIFFSFFSFAQKCDMIAISDFAAGAMENWGLITYRETALLIDPDTSPLANKQRVAYVVAHELAHQVFLESLCLNFDLCLNDYFFDSGLEIWLQWGGGVICG